MQKYNVVIQTAFIGDLFLSIPTLSRLKKIYPEHQTILVCKKGLGEFFLKLRWADQVFEVEKGNSKVYSQVISQINKNHIDNVFCLHRSFRSALLVFRIKAQYKIGLYSSRLEYLYKKIVFHTILQYPSKWPDVIRQMFILTPVDPQLKKMFDQGDWTYLNTKNQQQKFESIPEVFQFPVPDETRAVPVQKSVAIFPGSVWATKKWTHQGFAEVSKNLISKGYKIYIMGAPGDLADSEAIKNLVPEVQVLTGQMSLSDSALYIRYFDLIICNDSAPAHMAASLGRPVLCIFGPTVLDFGFRPWNNLSQVVELEDLGCRPCGPHGHRRCPLGHHDCMKKIDPNTVIATALDMLGEL